MGLDLLEITSENALFLYKVFRDPPESPGISKLLPSLNGTRLEGPLLRSLASHFIRVYAALWASPVSLITNAGEMIIKNYLNNDLNYSSVHKRSMEGGCSKVLADSTSLSDFDASELPMGHHDWKANLRNNHPICDMSYEFVKDTLSKHGRPCCNNLFIAFDGRGNIDKYVADNATIIRGPNFKNIISEFKSETKFLEMYLAIQGGFFIMNPRSTFSFEVFVVRTILGLESVPVLKSHDFFVKSPGGISRDNPLWVTFLSIEETVLNIYEDMSHLFS